MEEEIIKLERVLLNMVKEIKHIWIEYNDSHRNLTEQIKCKLDIDREIELTVKQIQERKCKKQVGG